jgi:hypothetical protein
MIVLATLVIAALSAAAYVMFSTTTTSPQKTVETFCRTLVEKDFQTAYDQFSHQLQQRVPESEIMKSYSSCTTAPSTVTTAHPQCTLLVTTKTNKKYWRLISLSLDEQHIWKINTWGVSHKG